MSHEPHKTETVAGALWRVLPEIEIYCHKIKKLIANIDNNKDEFENRKNEIHAEFEMCRKDAEIQLQKIIHRATEDYNALVKELDVRVLNEMDKIRLEKKKEYEQHVGWIETCKQSAEGVTLLQEVQSGLKKKYEVLGRTKVR